MVHSMPCRNSCRLSHPPCIHLLRWSLKRRSDRLRLPPMRVLEMQWSRALSLVCEVALEWSSPIGASVPSRYARPRTKPCSQRRHRHRHFPSFLATALVLALKSATAAYSLGTPLSGKPRIVFCGPRIAVLGIRI